MEHTNIEHFKWGI